MTQNKSNKYIILCFIIWLVLCVALLFGCQQKTYFRDEILYKEGLVEKETIYWKNKDSADKTITEYRLSAVPTSAKQLYGKPTIRYFKEATPMVVKEDKYMLQEVDENKTYKSKGKKVLSKSYIVTKNQRIMFTKIVFKDGVVSNVVVNDKDGRIEKVFYNYGHDEYFDELSIYGQSGKKITSKVIKIHTDTPLPDLKNYLQ